MCPRYFKSDPSEKYKKAVAILQELLEAEGYGVVNRAYAEVVADSVRENFASSGIKQRTTGHVCIHRLLGKPRCPNNAYNFCTSPSGLPGNDHPTEWVGEDGKTKCIVCQPYGLSYDQIKAVVEFCERHGLEASISAILSWWFPGWTVSLIYKKKRDT